MDEKRISKESPLVTNLLIAVEVLAVAAALGFVAYQDYKKYMNESEARKHTEQVQEQEQRPRYD